MPASDKTTVPDDLDVIFDEAENAALMPTLLMVETMTWSGSKDEDHLAWVGIERSSNARCGATEYVRTNGQRGLVFIEADGTIRPAASRDI